jgi:hypothetical protein
MRPTDHRPAVVRPIAVTLAIAATIAACSAEQPRQVVGLHAVEGYGPDGQVTLIGDGEHATRLEVQLGAPNTGVMPAHIHEGTCGNVTPQPRFPLESVAQGRSSTRVAVSMEELRTLPHTVNVHLSKDRLDVVVACADLSVVTASGALPATGGGHADHPALSQK